MAVKSKSRRRAIRRAVRGGVSRLRKQVGLAAPASAAQASPPMPVHEAGVLRPDAASWRLPNGLAEAGEADGSTAAPWWRPGPFVIVLTILALAFLSLIAWFVSRMPEKP